MLLFDCDVIELTSKVTIFFWIVQGGGGLLTSKNFLGDRTLPKHEPRENPEALGVGIASHVVSQGTFIEVSLEVLARGECIGPRKHSPYL